MMNDTLSEEKHSIRDERSYSIARRIQTGSPVAAEKSILHT